jgi:hypothetical protein
MNKPHPTTVDCHLDFGIVKEYSTVTSTKDKIFGNIHFTADNFDKFWNEINSTVAQAYEKGYEEGRKK